MNIAQKAVSEYMTTSPNTIGSDQSITFALKRMQELNIRHLPVLEGGELLGILSDRGLTAIAALNNVNPDETPVADAITRDAFTVTPQTPVLDVLQNMLNKKYGSALIVEGEEIQGVFTTHDALQLLIKVLS